MRPLTPREIDNLIVERIIMLLANDQSLSREDAVTQASAEIKAENS